MLGPFTFFFVPYCKAKDLQQTTGKLINNLAEVNCYKSVEP